MDRAYSMDDKSSHYSITSAILPSLGAHTNCKTKLRPYIISPSNPRYRYPYIFDIYICCLEVLCSTKFDLFGVGFGGLFKFEILLEWGLGCVDSSLFTFMHAGHLCG